MEGKIARQKRCGCDPRRDHAEAMRGHASARNHVASGEEKDRAGAVQTCVDSREVSVLFSDHTAGLVERRFAIRNARANMARENRSSVAIECDSGNVSIPG